MAVDRRLDRRMAGAPERDAEPGGKPVSVGIAQVDKAAGVEVSVAGDGDIVAAGNQLDLRIVEFDAVVPPSGSGDAAVVGKAEAAPAPNR